jgi:glycosidase
MGNEALSLLYQVIVNRKYFLYLFVVVFTANSCKLMKKEEADSKPIKTNGMLKRFKAPGWVHNTNIYEVNLRQYTKQGTINAFINELDRLKEMGVKTLWFMPVTPIAVKNRKGSMGSYYACSDYTAISPEFGTEDDFNNLVRAAHGKGMKVIIDWVANHTGWDHEWTKTHPEYYLKDSVTNDFKMASGMDDIIELDYSNPELRSAMTEEMKWWVNEFDIDGFRCDLAFWVELDFWKEARRELDAIKPLFWLGEFDELETPQYGEAFDASYTWTWMHKARDFYQNNLPVDSLYTVLKRYDDLGDGTIRAWFTTNHDENSWNGTEFEKYGDMAEALAVFSVTWNGIPLIYSGQENPNRKRLAFFEKDPIQWNFPLQNEVFYKNLLELRSSNPALRAGDPSVKTFRIKTDEPQAIFSYLRVHEQGEVLVILNLSRITQHFKILDEKVKGRFHGKGDVDFSSGQEFDLKGWGYMVLEKR